MKLTVTPSSGYMPAKFTAQDFMEVAVAFANAAIDDEVALLRGREMLHANRLTLGALRASKLGRGKAQVDAARTLHNEVFGALRALTEGTTEERNRWRRNAQKGLQEVRVTTTLNLSPRDRLVHQHGYVPGSDPAVIGLLYAFLLDPKVGLRKRLRLCDFNGCGRFFLASFGQRGGGNPKYCKEHRKAAEQEATRKRVRKMRAYRKAKRKSK